ncbi:MAG: 4Fe-4S dicluster domain-containing protein [Elusimicrobia bacterium]|nr:4Fe-4S dicluster domain-containing protein [Elusimicrobiota bacterium]
MIQRINTDRLKQLLKDWAEVHDVFVPDEQGRLVRFEEDGEINWNIVPVWGGLKEFIYPPRNTVAGSKEDSGKLTVVVGARDCDVRALVNVFDRIMLEKDPADTVYKNRREKIRIVTVDCSSPADTCFCTAVGGKPYCDKGFDLNLSFIGDKVLIETGTDGGQALLKGLNSKEPENDEIDRKDSIRDTSTRKVKANFDSDYKSGRFGDRISGNSEEKYWEKKSEDCMQCGGCNFCCPTCYCNVLNEQSSGREIVKVLQWDSCQFPGYARVAGGANPRKELWMRFRHRYYCKFSLMPGEFDIAGCTGCGRCIQVCPGKIDIRDTIKGLL